MTSAVNSLRQDISKMEEVSKLQQSNVELEERVRGNNGVLEEVRRGLAEAKVREANIQKSTESIIKSFAEATQNRIKSQSKDAEPMYIALSQITLKYSNLSTQCADERRRADKNEEYLRLKEQAENQLKIQLREAEVEREEAHHNLCKAQNQLKAQALQKEKWEQELINRATRADTEREEALSNLKKVQEELIAQELEKARLERKLTERATESEAERGELCRDLNRAQEELKAQVLQDHIQAKEEISHLKSELSELLALRDEAAKVPVLSKALEAHVVTISELNTKCAELDEVKDRNSALEDRIAIMSSELRSLGTQIRKDEKTDQVIGQLQQRVSEAVEQMTTLKEMLNEAQAKADRVAPLEDELHSRAIVVDSLNSRLHAMNNTLAEAQDKASLVAPLLDEVSAKTAETASLKSRLDILNDNLTEAQDKASKTTQLEEELNTKCTELKSLNSRLATLNNALAKAEEVAAKVALLEDKLQRKASEIDSLNARLSEAEKISVQVHDLQKCAGQAQAKFNDLVGEHEIATLAAAIAALCRTGMTRKTGRLGLCDRRLPIWSRKMPESYPENRDGIPENFLSQETILSLDQLIACRQVSHAAAQTVAATGLNLAGNKQGQPRGANRDADRGTEQGRRLEASTPNNDPTTKFTETVNQGLESVPEFTLASAFDPYSTQQTSRIPDSQLGLPLVLDVRAVNDTQEALKHQDRSLPSLSDIGNLFSSSEFDSEPESEIEVRGNRPGNSKGHQEVNTARSRVPFMRDAPLNRLSSSSHGEPMLLEDLEHLKNEEPLAIHYAKRFGPNTAAAENLLPSPKACGHSTQNGPKPFQDQAMPRNISTRATKTVNPFRGASSTRSAQSLRDIPLTVRTVSNLNIISSSPSGAAKERYQPNSAAKRRVEPEPTPSTGRSINKRLKRMPGNLEVRKSAKESSKSTSPGSEGTTPGRHDVPSGSRKGSIIGTAAPAPGKSQRTKYTRTGSKGDRYSTRFSPK